jgi:hypothetical protein
MGWQSPSHEMTQIKKKNWLRNQYREKEIVDLWLFDTKIMLRSVWKKIAKKRGRGNVGHDPMYLWSPSSLRYIFHKNQKNYCEVISKRILIIFAPEDQEAEICKDYLFLFSMIFC